MIHKKRFVANASDSAHSTKSAILHEANSMISDIGMSDFKIDMLSTALSLSPGNITYHFPKKEDIATALWDKVMYNINVLFEISITSILDIKQLFLFVRSIFIENYQFRGVVAYKLGDINVLRSSIEDYFYVENQSRFDSSFLKIVNTLYRNGYIVEMDPKELSLIHPMIMQLIFWGFLDKKILKTSQSSVESAAQLYADQALSPLLNYLTDSGSRQYDSVILILNRQSNEKKH